MTKTIKSFTKRLFTFILVVAAAVTLIPHFALDAQAAGTAAYGQISSSKPMKTHILSTSNIACYTDSSLSVRGTATAGRSNTAYIAPSDDVYVLGVGSNLKWAKVTYPVGNRRYTAYIGLNQITSNNGNHAKTVASAKVMTYKRTSTSTGANTMYISPGETVYLVATGTSYYQVMYPCSGGWRLAWVTKSNYDKYLSGNGGQNNTSISVRSTAPGTGNQYYYSSMNPFYPRYAGQCTWYAYGRAYEILGKKPALSMGHAGQWYGYNKTYGYYGYGSTPRVGAIICWGNGTYGHVAVVEKVYSNGNVDCSESNVSTGTVQPSADNRRFRYTVNINPATWNSNFQGYIYLK